MSKASRRYKLEEGRAELEILVAKDYRIQEFSEYHFRINERLDVWPSTKKWMLQNRTGQYETLLKLVEQLLK